MIWQGELGFQRMKAMARQRSHSIALKRQVAQEFIAGASLYALSKRHDISRQLIRVYRVVFGITAKECLSATVELMSHPFWAP